MRIRKIFQSELYSILKLHLLYLQDNEDGKKADLSFTYLRGANLCVADLSGADLSFTDLSCADLRSADLRGADLRGTNLSFTDLRGTNLSFTNLSGADLRGADLRGANLIKSDIKLFQSGLWTAYISSNSIRIGCKIYSVEEWINFSDEEINEMNSNALEYWRENKAIILSIAESLKSNESNNND